MRVLRCEYDHNDNANLDNNCQS